MPICPNCEMEYDEETCKACQKENGEPLTTKSEGRDGEMPPELIHKSPFVRATVRVLMLVGFLILVTLVVVGTDALIEWVRNLF